MKNDYKFVFVLLASFLVTGLTLGNAQEASAQTSEKAHAHSTRTMSSGKAGHALADAESLGGTVSMIGNAGEMLTLTGSNGVPYDFKVTGHTRIKIAGNPAKFDDLKGQMNKQAAIEFVPMSDGNIAKTVNVS